MQKTRIQIVILLTGLLTACGGAGGGTNVEQLEPLEPVVEFTAPNPGFITGIEGTARVKLLVTNTTQSRIYNIAVNFIYPGVAIEGWSIATICGAVNGGSSSGNGYQITYWSLAPGEKCGISMDIYSTTGTGAKTFYVWPNSITGDAVAPNAKTYTWIWNAP